MYRRSELSKILSSDTPIDFCYLATTLSFFNEHKEALTKKDLKKLVDKVEECRLYLNQNANDPMTRESINPNIYEYYRLQKIKNNKEVEYIETNYAVPV